MLRSLSTAVLGLRAHQEELDVVGDNVANVNTPGFKAAHAVFSSMFAQVVRPGSASAAPLQVGLGVRVAATLTDPTQGGLMVTNRPTDLAVDGEGYFVLLDGGVKVYTRAGSFRWDAEGKLVDPEGRPVLGWQARDGVLPADLSSRSLGPVSFRGDFTAPASATTKVVLGKNLAAGENGSFRALSGQTLSVAMPSGQVVPVSVSLAPTADFRKWRWSLGAAGGSAEPASGYLVFDASGNLAGVTDNQGNPVGSITVTAGSESASVSVSGSRASLVFSSGSERVEFAYEPFEHTVCFDVYGPKGELCPVSLVFRKADNGVWDWSARVSDPQGAPVPASPSSGQLRFDSSGRLVAVSGDELGFVLGDGAQVRVKLDFSGVTQFAGASTAQAVSSDGCAAGDLVSVSVDERGTVVGAYTNGQKRVLGRLALARFADPGGLVRLSGGCFRDGPASGSPVFGEPGLGGMGRVVSGALEMSNVDLARELTRMIVAQRGFLANARVVSASDEVLQELVNMKR